MLQIILAKSVMAARGATAMLLLLSTAAALRVPTQTIPALKNARLPIMANRPNIANMCLHNDQQRDSGAQREVRVVVQNDLIAAKTKTKKGKKTVTQPPPGLRSFTIGGKTLHFEKDMTSTTRFLGVIIVLLAVRIVRKGKCVLPDKLMQRYELSTDMIHTYAFVEEPQFKYMARTSEEELELHEFRCDRCGFTIFPARGREGKFFPDNYKCQNPSGKCGATKEDFFDMTDLSDPRTVKALQNDDDFDYEIEEIEVKVDDGDDGPDGRDSKGKSSS